jgi:hypothetical protein
MEHPALFMNPREAYEQGMELAGARSHRVIAYSETFLMREPAYHPNWQGQSLPGTWHHRQRVAKLA